MKTAVRILFLSLALFFFSKSLTFYCLSVPKYASIAVDMEENESEKSEKEGTKGKEKYEEKSLSEFKRMTLLNQFFKRAFRSDKTTGLFTPYFEVCSPPPELV